VEIPRALETVIAKSTSLGPILAGAFNVAVIGAAAQAVIAVGQSFYTALQSVGGFTAAVQASNEALKKANDEAFVNPKTLAAAELHTKQLNTELAQNDKLKNSYVERAQKLAQESSTLDNILGITSFRVTKELFVNSAIDKGVKLQQQVVDLASNKNVLDVERAKLQDEVTAKEKIAGLQGIALAQQELANFKQSKTYQVMKVADAQAAALMLEGAEADSHNKILEIVRASHDSTIALRHSVLEDSVQGTARITQVETDAIEDVDRKRKASLLTESDAQQQRVLVHERAAAQMNLAELSIEKGIVDANLFAEDRANSYLEGTAKIIADSEHEKNVLTANLNFVSAQFGVTSKEGQAAWFEYVTKVLAVDEGATRKIANNHLTLEEKLKEMQEQSAVAALPEWLRADAQVLLDRQKTIDELSKLERKDVANFDLYEQMKISADQLANAKMLENHKRMVEQIGSDLEAVFNDIGSGNLGKRVLANMEKLFFQIIAKWLLATQSMNSIFGKLFGTLLGGPGSSLESASGGGIGPLIGLFGGSSGGGASLGSGGSAVGGLFGGLGAMVPASATAGAGGFSASSALTTASLSNSGLVAFGTPSSNKNPSPIFGGGGAALGVNGLFGSQAVLALAMAGMVPGGDKSLLGKIGQVLSPTGLFSFGKNHGPVLGSIVGFLTLGITGLLSGLFGGILGAGKRRKQADAFAGSMLPQITAIEDDYKNFGIDSASAISQLEALRTQSADQLKALKGEGSSVMNNKIGPAIDAAEKDIKGFQADRDHRSSLTFGAPEFGSGGFTGYGRGGFHAILHPEEFVVNPAATRKNRGTLEAMNGGGSGGSGPNFYISINATDSKSFDAWAKGGGAKMMTDALRRHWGKEGN
jgi:hypothetical protein